MKKYIYRFADGTISAVEVDEQTFAVLQEFDKAERNNDRAETRRHISFEENGLEISDTGTDIESIIEEAELISELKRAIALLTKEDVLFILHQRQDSRERRKGGDGAAG